MGACDWVTLVEKKMTDEEVQKEFQELKEDCEYRFGHEGYTGTLAEKPGVKIICRDMNMDKKQAEEYISENNNKWDDAYAVKLSDGTWVIGGVCSC